MIRSFIVLLLLAVFFLSGMLYGIDRESSTEPSSVTEDQLETGLEESSFSSHENKNLVANSEILESSEQNFTQQIASFLEAGVKGIYDVIVHMLYQVAQIFF